MITTESPLSAPRNGVRQDQDVGRAVRKGTPGPGDPVTIVYPAGVVGPYQPASTPMGGLRAGMKQGWPITSGGVGVVDVRDLALVLARCVEPGRGPRRYMLGGHFLPGRNSPTCATR